MPRQFRLFVRERAFDRGRGDDLGFGFLGAKEPGLVAAVPAKPAAKVVARPAPSASKPRIGKVRVSRGPTKPAKKSYTRWDKPRSLKGRAARQARK